MAGEKVDPLRELMALQQQITRRVEERLGAGARAAAMDPLPETTAGAWSPPMDLFETADGFVLRADLPGIEADDVALTIAGRVLSVRGIRRGPGPEKTTARKSKRSSRVEAPEPSGAQEFHRMEREYGVFQRSFTLPCAVDPARLSSRWYDGILEVRLSKKSANAPSPKRNRRKG